MRLRELRKNKKMSMKELGAIFDLSESTISLYETGKRRIDTDMLQKFADFFEVSVDYILGRDIQHSTPTKKGIKIPVLGRVAAGIPITAVEDILDYEEIEESLAKTGEFYGLQIKGTSMEPRMKEGDVVIVRRQDDVESGEIAIVLVNGDDATCKRVVKHENGLSLISLNPVFPPRFYTDDEVRKLPVQIIGRVVELRAKF